MCVYMCMCLYINNVETHIVSLISTTSCCLHICIETHTRIHTHIYTSKYMYIYILWYVYIDLYLFIYAHHHRSRRSCTRDSSDPSQMWSEQKLFLSNLPQKLFLTYLYTDTTTSVTDVVSCIYIHTYIHTYTRTYSKHTYVYHI